MSATEVPPQTEEDLLDDAAEPVVGIKGAEALMQAVEEAAQDVEVEDFTAPISNLNHGHGLDKHDVRAAFGVRDEFVEAHFGDIVPNDHAALWLLKYRQQEFIDSDEPLFADKPDDHAPTWRRISSMAQHAPIPSEVHQRLKP